MGIPLKWIFEAGNDQIVQWGPIVTGLTQNLETPTYVNDCTGTANLFDPEGNSVPGFINIPFNYVPASNGIYLAQVLGVNFNPPIGDGYKLQIKLISPTEGAGKWTPMDAEVIVRTD